MSLKRLKDADANEVLRSALMRVEAIARFHRILCAPTNSDAVDGSTYIPRIAREISASTGLACHVRAEPVTIASPIALDLAIAINELVINAAKHAYCGRSGEPIEIECLSNGDGQLRISVSDRGPGVPPDFDPAAAPSLGMTLLRAITEKHGGELQVANNNGDRFTMAVPSSASGLHTPMSSIVFGFWRAVVSSCTLAQTLAIYDVDHAALGSHEFPVHECMNCLGYAWPAGSHHQRQKFMGERNFIVVHAVMRHQNPPRQPLFYRRFGVRNGGMGRLNHEGLGVAQKSAVERRACFHRIAKLFHIHALSVTANLHIDGVRRAVISMNDRQAGHAFTANQANLDLRVSIDGRHDRCDAMFDKKNVLDRSIGVSSCLRRSRVVA